MASVEEHSPLVENTIFFGSLMAGAGTVGLYELAFDI